jgi:hypothetical protein
VRRIRHKAFGFHDLTLQQAVLPGTRFHGVAVRVRVFQL